MAGYPLGELLMGIAQIAIAFVGFAAIVEVVRERTHHERSQFENLLARTMIEFGFSALFLALLPLVALRFFPAVFRAWMTLTLIVVAGLAGGAFAVLNPDAVYIVSLVWLLICGSISFVVIVSVLD